MESEITILGRQVKITLTAEQVCAHSPDVDDFYKRLKENTVSLNLRGVIWELNARSTGFSPYIIEVQLRSKGHPFKGENLAVSIQIHRDGFEYIDQDIISSMLNHKEAQEMFIEHAKQLG